MSKPEEKDRPSLIDKCRAVYKGDMLLGLIYIGIFIFFTVTTILLLIFTSRIGWKYLSIGLAVFGLYALGKGFSLYFLSKKRYEFYMPIDNLIGQHFIEEMSYNSFRLNKKVQNRRRYVYTLVFGILILFLGLVLQERGLILGTFIPITLFASIEFVIGLAVEFRLWEYHRLLEKEERK